MKRSGLLILSNFARLRSTLKFSRQHVDGTLFVQLYIPLAKAPISTPRFGELVNRVYAQSLHDCRDLDVRIIVKERPAAQLLNAVQVLMMDPALPSAEVDRLSQLYKALDIVSIVHAPDSPKAAASGEVEPEAVEVSVSDGQIAVYKDTCAASATDVVDCVVAGGTFDRLHVGHKILLTASAIRARKRFVVGVTQECMMKRKTLGELILPSDQRIAEMHDFLRSIDDSLDYDLVPIFDPFGPTLTDATMELIVVSAETLANGKRVNEERAKLGLSQLLVHSIDLIDSGVESAVLENKVSSSNQRLSLMGRRWGKAAQLPLPKPYVVAVVGTLGANACNAIAKLSSYNVGVLDCDAVLSSDQQSGLSFDERLATLIPLCLSKAQTKDVIFLYGSVFYEHTVYTRLQDKQHEYHEIWSVLFPDTNVSEVDRSKPQIMSRKEAVERSSVLMTGEFGEEFLAQQVKQAYGDLRQLLDDSQPPKA